MKATTLLLPAILGLALPSLAQGLGQSAAAAPAQAFSGVKPVLEGSEKVALSPGTFDHEQPRMSGSSYIPVVGLFTSSVIQTLWAPGEFSDTKAPQDLKWIALTGYSPKALGMYGDALLCKFKLEDGKRYIQTKDMEVIKDYYKPVKNVAKLTQTPEGAWGFAIKTPLEPGHYTITFLKSSFVYWDFDVR